MNSAFRALECNICITLYTSIDITHQPRSLPCGHTFCYKCLSDLFKNKCIKCPYDKKVFKYANTDEIPRNYTVIDDDDQKQNESSEIITEVEDIQVEEVDINEEESISNASETITTEYPSVDTTQPRWTCNVCSIDDNLEENNECYVCKTIRTTTIISSINILPPWTCSTCTYNENHPDTDTCNVCETVKSLVESQSNLNTITTTTSVPVTKKENDNEILSRVNVRELRLLYNNTPHSSTTSVSTPQKQVKPSNNPSNLLSKNLPIPSNRVSNLTSNIEREESKQTSRRIEQTKITECNQSHLSNSTFSTPIIDGAACPICSEILSNSNIFPSSESTTDCLAVCNACMSDWLNTQITSGNSIQLTCLCQKKHKINYKIFRTAHNLGLISSQAYNIYNSENRRLSTQNDQNSPIPLAGLSISRKKEDDDVQVNGKIKMIHSIVIINCQSCSSEYSVSKGSPSFKCCNPSCIVFDIPICVKHGIRYDRPRNIDGSHIVLNSDKAMFMGGRGTSLQLAPRCCVKCVDAAGGHTVIVEILETIQEKFVDTCISCSASLGEPESFEFCMALECSNCPSYVCGFCYLYAGNRNDCHSHVRQCKSNPRENYFAESEAIWRDLMVKRRKNIAKEIIASSSLSIVDKRIAEAAADKIISSLFK